MYKHIFFDLDNTLTRTRSLVTPGMKDKLEQLMKQGRDLVIVSGATIEQMKKQTDNLGCLYLGQNGNHTVDTRTGEELWRHMLTEKEKAMRWDPTVMGACRNAAFYGQLRPHHRIRTHLLFR